MISVPRRDMAPDMGRILLALPSDLIVYLSWIVSEYDGLGFVKTETRDGVGEQKSPREKNRVKDVSGLVSLYFPSEKRQDVLELIDALKTEGISLEFLSEEKPCTPGAKTHDNYPEEFDLI